MGAGVGIGTDVDFVAHEYIPQAGNPITNTRAVIRITLPHTQSPVGLGRSSADGSFGDFRVDFGSGSGSGSGVDTGLGSGFRVGLGCDNGFGLGSSLGFGSGVGPGEGAGFGVEGVPNGRNASQDRVSALTCIPYLTPACLALVQLKNLSPFFGLKFWQLPHILLLITDCLSSSLAQIAETA